MALLEGKKTIITGAASGIGRASAIRFAREGASVLIADRAADGLAETLKLATAAGPGQVMAMSCDAGDEPQVMALVEKAVQTFGGLDAIYANAGISGGWVPLFEETVENFQEILRINLIGPFLAIKHAAPLMARQGKGSIVCTASVAGLRANAGGTPYSASKAGVVSLVQTAANALYGSGVRVNAICPGLIETGMTRPIFDMARAKGTDERIGQLNPLKRHGIPEEIAAVAAFLASDDASYVNGQAIPVDGGLSSTLPFVRSRPA